jgi:hypothetical protein
MDMGGGFVDYKFSIEFTNQPLNAQKAAMELVSELTIDDAKGGWSDYGFIKYILKVF